MCVGEGGGRVGVRGYWTGAGGESLRNGLRESAGADKVRVMYTTTVADMIGRCGCGNMGGGAVLYLFFAGMVSWARAQLSYGQP